MNYQELLRSLKKVSYFNIVNYYKPAIEKKLNSIIPNKKKSNLRNSNRSNDLFYKNFGKNLEFDEFRRVFFDKKLFSYSNEREEFKIIEALNQNHSNSIINYIEIANQIVAKEFVVFEKKYEFKDEINWHYSFFGDFNWSLENSDKININPINKGQYIDVKYVWELNRHQFLPYLGFAYYITKDEKYALEFKQLILDWIKKNPPLYGINWVSGLEISLRLISWIFTLFFFRDSKEINNNHFFSKTFKVLFQHAYYLRFFYTKRSLNHTIGELFGGYLFSHIFNDYKSMKNWEQVLFKHLKKQICLQIRPDGFNIEQSVNYHRFVLEFFMIFLLLNKDLVDSPEGILIKKMAINLSDIVKPNGLLPLVGDVDSGKVLLLTGYNDKSHFDLINLGSTIFKSSDLKPISKEESPISLLLLGSEEMELRDSLKFENPEKKVRYYKNSGYILLREGFGDKSSYLFGDIGRFGPRIAPHSHSGITNIIFSYNGKDILIDSGTKSYNTSQKERNYFRGSLAHNVISIDNKHQATPLGWFTWIQKPKTSRKVLESSDLIQILCNHDGYGGFLVQRLILATTNLKSIIVKDKIQLKSKEKDDKKHQIELNYHFPDGTSLNVDLKEKNTILINEEIMLTISANSSFKYKLESAEMAPKYGETRQISVLKIQVFENFSSKNSVSITTEFRAIDQ